MATEGVIGYGFADKNTVVVYLLDSTFSAKIPKTLDGHRVVTEYTGVVTAHELTTG